MPKARETCTRCSLRRQKCDKKDPCTRCVRAGEASSCSRTWENGYDAQIHRTYPSRKHAHSLVTDAHQGPDGSEVMQVETSSAHDSAPALKAPSALSPLQGVQQSAYIADPQSLMGVRFPNDLGRSAPLYVAPGQATTEPAPFSFVFDKSATEPTAISGPKCAQPPTRQIVMSTTQGNAVAQPQDVEIQKLQSLVPTTHQILRLWEYHETHLLWYHACLHGPTFRHELLNATQGHEDLQLKSFDILWCSLLFSIMAASLACTRDATANSWGFPKARKLVLSKQWYNAAVSCLHLGGYSSRVHFYSIQAIQILDLSAHALGLSNEQFIIQGTGLKIAQSLRLHRLEEDPDIDIRGASNGNMPQTRKDLRIKREIGRRLWTRFCTHDWFSIPSFEMYSIRKEHFTTSRPHRYDDETMTSVGDRSPAVVDFANYLYDVASLMSDFHDSVSVLGNPRAKYEQVLKFDSKLRALGTDPVPSSHTTESDESFKPLWVKWARTISRVLHAHKIIMIHRSFLKKSFTDSQFTYSRWASITASKSILDEVQTCSQDVGRPAIWNEQAHLIGAGITLSVDLLHLRAEDPQFTEHRKLIDRALFFLSKYEDSALASRGMRSIFYLLKNGTVKQSQPQESSDSFTWPIENEQNIDNMESEKQPKSRSDNTNGTSNVPSAEAGIQKTPQAPKTSSNRPSTVGNGSAVPGLPTTQQPGAQQQELQRQQPQQPQQPEQLQQQDQGQQQQQQQQRNLNFPLEPNNDPLTTIDDASGIPLGLGVMDFHSDLFHTEGGLDDFFMLDDIFTLQ